MKGVILFFITVCFACGNSTVQLTESASVINRNAGVGFIEIENDTIYSHPINRDSINNSEYVVSWINKYIGSFKYEIQFDVKEGRDNVVICSIKIIGEIPNATHRYFTLVCNGESNSACILPIEYNKYFNLHEQQMVGGFYESREFDYYYIYYLTDKKVIRILDTRQLENTYVAYYKVDECIEFISHRLNFKVTGNEIFFEGHKRFFCQDGVDRDSSMMQDIKIEPIKIIFTYDNQIWKKSR